MNEVMSIQIIHKQGKVDAEVRKIKGGGES